MKKAMISEVEVLNFFLNVCFNMMYNRCYIHKPCKECYYIRFDTATTLDILEGYFKAYCKQINRDYYNVTIEHREFVGGRLINDTDYVLWLTTDTNLISV